MKCFRKFLNLKVGWTRNLIDFLMYNSNNLKNNKTLQCVYVLPYRFAKQASSKWSQNCQNIVAKYDANSNISQTIGMKQFLVLTIFGTTFESKVETI